MPILIDAVEVKLDSFLGDTKFNGNCFIGSTCQNLLDNLYLRIY